jgi:peptidyl-prolyl cis-trans isomerase C
MIPTLTRVLAGSLLALAVFPAMAQDAEDRNKVIATVDGSPITNGDIAYSNEFLGPRLEQVPEQFRGRVLLDVLIERKLFAGLAREAGVEGMEAFRERLAFLTEEALRDIYVAEIMRDDITEADVRTRYDVEVAKLPKTEEMRARHILVETEDEAKALAEEARGGSDFAELAKTRSTGPSGPNGGDLGYFTADRMVPEFSAAATKLQPGGISDPVKTQFGWHVIKLEDRREKAPPTLQDVSDQLRAVILRERVRTRSNELREAATIEYAEGMAPPAPPAAAADDAKPAN